MSDILRLIAGGLLGLCCCYGGVLIKRHYKDREKFYAEAAEFTSVLASELGFKKTSLPIVVGSFAEGRKSAFCRMLHSYLASLGSSAPLTEENLPQYLKAEEKKRVLSFLAELGKTSLGDQLDSINRANKEFGDKHRKCADESKRLGGMYFKLAVLMGIALIIVLA